MTKPKVRMTQLPGMDFWLAVVDMHDRSVPFEDWDSAMDWANRLAATTKETSLTPRRQRFHRSARSHG